MLQYKFFDSANIRERQAMCNMEHGMVIVNMDKGRQLPFLHVFLTQEDIQGIIDMLRKLEAGNGGPSSVTSYVNCGEKENSRPRTIRIGLMDERHLHEEGWPDEAQTLILDNQHRIPEPDLRWIHQNDSAKSQG